MKTTIKLALALAALLAFTTVGSAQCTASPGAAGVSAQQILDTDSVNHRLLAEAELFKETMDVSADLYWYVESAGENAYSEPDGNVVLGLTLLRHCQQTDKGLFMISLGWVMAHEYGHQFQFKMAEHFEPGPVAELQADLLGGYWAGERLQDQGYGDDSITKDVILKKAWSIGDYAFKDPRHHGLPESRKQATAIGVGAGNEKKFGDLNESFSDNAQKLYDWSYAKAKQIYSKELSHQK